ncbi:MAG: DUF721 domain-containing protein [Ignavibacteriae bacterium]|nr:DUF721 domain-containing protein [Ignavibacteriota bacterium]
MKRVDTKRRVNRVICLKEEIDGFVKYLGLDEKLQEMKILEAWKECVGKTISEFSKPVEIKKNKLFVRVENAVWRFELSAKRNEIISKLNLILSREDKKKNIKEIVFI